MNVISIEYILFIIPLILLINYLPKKRLVIIFLGSLVFYSFSGMLDFTVITVLILINYFAGIITSKSIFKNNKILILTIIFNILILIVFKSSLFFKDLYVVNYFPVGLSFVTFTILSYNIELHRGNINPEKNFINFAIYILFFPKILQGPIERPNSFLEELKKDYSFDYRKFNNGLKLICWGLFKKLIIADRAAVITNNIFNNPGDFSGFATLTGILIYSIQIYADFSGLIDIVIGTSNLCGIQLNKNFNSPYFSMSIKEFWDKWHITLSQWLRDYIFLPISYSMIRKVNNLNCQRKTNEIIAYSFSVLVTFSICGLWHGLSLNFLIWGLLFAFYMIFSRLTLQMRKQIKKVLKITETNIINKLVKVLITFSLVTFSWIFFRSSSFHNSILLIKNIIDINMIPLVSFDISYLKSNLSGFGLPETEFYILIISTFILFIVEYFNRGGNIFEFINKKPLVIRWISYYAIVFIILFLSYKGSNQDFIYKQF